MSCRNLYLIIQYIYAYQLLMQCCHTFRSPFYANMFIHWQPFDVPTYGAECQRYLHCSWALLHSFHIRTTLIISYWGVNKQCWRWITFCANIVIAFSVQQMLNGSLCCKCLLAAGAANACWLSLHHMLAGSRCSKCLLALGEANACWLSV